MLFFLALILYIASVVCCLICAITIKKPPVWVIRSAAGMHVLFLLLLIAYLIFQHQARLPVFLPLSLLFYCCSGIILFGLAINLQKKGWLKIYSGIFILTFPVFVVKPSVVIHFMLDMEIKSREPESFSVKDNVLLQFQPTSTGNDTTCCRYKLVMKHGIFTQTLKRDIKVVKTLDSIRTIEFNYPGDITLRGYFKDDKGNADSTLISIPHIEKK
jgi:hypothetical protein